MSKLSLRTLISIANDVAIESFGESSFTFSSLWAKTWTKAKDFKKENIEDWISSFYLEVLGDPRFVYIGNNMWKLREFMGLAEYLKVMGKRSKNIVFSEKDLDDEDSSSSEETTEELKAEEDEDSDLDSEEGDDSSSSNKEYEENEELGQEGSGYQGRIKSNEEEDEESFE